MEVDVFGPGDDGDGEDADVKSSSRSEEHTSELQTLVNHVCRFLLEKKKENPRDPRRENSSLGPT